MFLVLALGITATKANGQTGVCLFDGHVYKKGDTIIIQPCLASMKCEGDNLYSQPQSLVGLCPKATREVNGQEGCLYDGRVYSKGDIITVQPCLARFTCMGRNSYSDITMLG
ncbi:hypothetical protein ACOMHN_037261 [Nucella lapillus]